MLHKIFMALIIAVAVIVALLAVVLPLHHLADIISISKFFEVMIPILAVGALIKYLCCEKK